MRRKLRDNSLSLTTLGIFLVLLFLLSFLLSFAGHLLGIFLRERGSPESKRVAAPHAETGSG